MAAFFSSENFNLDAFPVDIAVVINRFFEPNLHLIEFILIVEYLCNTLQVLLKNIGTAETEIDARRLENEARRVWEHSCKECNIHNIVRCVAKHCNINLININVHHELVESDCHKLLSCVVELLVGVRRHS